MNNVLHHYGVQPPNQQALYTRANGRFYTLSAEEEAQALSAISEAGRLVRLQKTLSAKHGRAPTLSAWAAAARLDETALKQRLADGLSAKQLLVATNIPLVYSIVYKQYAQKVAREGLHLSLSDLVQEGVVGLVHAAELFNESRATGARFRTYAWYWVKAYIDQGILSGGHAMKVPRRTMQTYQSAVRTLSKQLQRAPTDSELASHLNMTPEDVARKYGVVSNNRTHVLSLDMRLSDGHDMSEHLLSTRSTENELEEAERSALGRDLQQVLRTALSERERRVLSLRYGLQDGRMRTIKETAAAAGLSLDVTRRMLESSIPKVRSHILLTDNALKEYAVGV